ncbi:hypothetical protein PUNSTDRAFT_131664 [Punctularia strigosozonata HHB-11173 SS5]|uniref:uncharacterized protein n=1 Tax=Punctularia strigosozonata (strain HHB-11173) TaxID=741275 RepID=UPI000441664E|nr:uncharacterized protein PUNSTDRAFT_131664 [Punctularia strigosozonata HHB-11173 SS5]EIN11499.1 hypothetical protein PUNSTDRAFT_131664 [Punctularia strigosozonata HHB-11173 SS5]
MRQKQLDTGAAERQKRQQENMAKQRLRDRQRREAANDYQADDLDLESELEYMEEEPSTQTQFSTTTVLQPTTALRPIENQAPIQPVRKSLVRTSGHIPKRPEPRMISADRSKTNVPHRFRPGVLPSAHLHNPSSLFSATTIHRPTTVLHSAGNETSIQPVRKNPVHISGLIPKHSEPISISADSSETTVPHLSRPEDESGGNQEWHDRASDDQEDTGMLHDEEDEFDWNALPRSSSPSSSSPVPARTELPPPRVTAKSHRQRPSSDAVRVVKKMRSSDDCPYPSADQQVQWAKRAWSHACRQKGVEGDLTEDLVKLITNRGSHIRGSIRDAARPHVKGQYGLRPPSKTNPTITRLNRDRVELLKDNARFYCENPEAEEGEFEHPVIQDVLNSTLFKDRLSPGVIHQQYFTPELPLTTLALILTAIECVLDEWKTGEEKRLNFSEKEYKDVFEEHLAALEQWQNRVPYGMATIRRGLTENARLYAKAPIEAQPTHVRSLRLDENRLEAAERRWEARRQIAEGGHDAA